jgi:hypothetical protein
MGLVGFVGGVAGVVGSGRMVKSSSTRTPPSNPILKVCVPAERVLR